MRHPRSIRPSLLPTGLLISLGVSLAACGGGGDDAATLTATARSSTVMAGQAVVLDIAIDGLDLVDPDTTPTPADGQGHYHVYLDDAAGADYLVKGITPEVSVTIPAATTAGAHALTVRAVANDHQLLADVVAVTLPITVEAAELPMVTAIADVTTVVDGGTVTLTITVENFTLAPGSVGGANVAGDGHYHVAIVGEVAYEVGATPTIPFTVNVAAPGEHVINVSLRNNDHGPVTPATEVEVPITVTAP